MKTRQQTSLIQKDELESIAYTKDTKDLMYKQ
jgi:hypothetical protein